MAKFIDLMGQKFDNLMVVKYIGQDKHKQSIWECLCDCGNTRESTTSNLRQNKVKYCLACGESRRKIDLSGKKFDKLTVIRDVGCDEKHRGRVWLCKCDCGNEISMGASVLKSGKSKSCGCSSSIQNLTGKRFGKLVVLRRESVNKHGSATWQCQCDCGSEPVVKSTKELKTKRLQSCDCSIVNKNRADIAGRRYGKLVAIKDVGLNKKSGSRLWLCKCDCGGESTVSPGVLNSGNTKSCGCEKTRAHNKTHDCKPAKLHSVWSSMKDRCYNPNYKGYCNYGGRGIEVCDEWKDSYISFRDWAFVNGYQEGLSIDRIDNNGPYAPWNARWVEKGVQANNTRANVWITINGETKTMAQWSKYSGVSYDLIRNRVNRKIPPEHLLDPPRNQATAIEINGITKTVTEWGREFGIKPVTIGSRIRAGWTGEDLLLSPNAKKEMFK